MSANTRPYIIELAGKPVAIADTISRSAAAALYARSLQISARVASASDVLALRTLPVLEADEPVPVPDFESGDLFPLAQQEPPPATLATCDPVQVGDAGKQASLPMARFTQLGVEIGAPEVAAAPLGEPAELVALDVCAPAGVEQACSESDAAAVPAQPDDIGHQVRELAMLLGCERPDMPVDTPQELVDLLQQHGLNEFNGRGHDLCRLFWQHYYPTAATAHPNGTGLAEAMASKAPALMLPAERVSHAYATGYRLGAAGHDRWSAEWLTANDAERDGMSDSESTETHDAMISGTRAGVVAFVAKAQAGSELKRQAAASAQRAGGKIVAKYRNADGSTWTGRGLKPRWMVQAIEAGQSQDDFLIKKEAA